MLRACVRSYAPVIPHADDRPLSRLLIGFAEEMAADFWPSEASSDSHRRPASVLAFLLYNSATEREISYSRHDSDPKWGETGVFFTGILLTQLFPTNIRRFCP